MVDIRHHIDVADLELRRRITPAVDTGELRVRSLDQRGDVATGGVNQGPVAPSDRIRIPACRPGRRAAALDRAGRGRPTSTTPS